MPFRFSDCLLASSHRTWMTKTWSCMYSLRLLMTDEKTSETCRVLCQNKINLIYCAAGWVYYRNILRCTVLQKSKIEENLALFPCYQLLINTQNSTLIILWLTHTHTRTHTLALITPSVETYLKLKDKWWWWSYKIRVSLTPATVKASSRNICTVISTNPVYNGNKLSYVPWSRVRGSAHIPPLILNFTTRWRSAISHSPTALQPEKGPRH
jgi:hypothetical protein